MVLINKNHFAWGLILLLTLQLSVAGCQKKQEAKPTPSKSSEEQKTKPPEDAKKILEEIDKVLKALDMKARKEKLPEMAQQQSAATEKKSTGDQSSSSQGGQGEGQKEGSSSDKSQQEKGSSSSGGQKSTQQTSPATDWQTETASVIKIHQSWNSMEPEAIKAGVTTEDLSAFETSLDELTLAMNKKQLADAMKAAITLYRDFGQVMSYFSSELPKEYFQVKYQVMMTMLEAYNGNWEAAAQYMMDIEDPWSRLHTQMDKKHKEDTDRTEYAIKDLERAVSQQDMGLTYIKGEIVLENLKKFESQGQGQEQQQ